MKRGPALVTVFSLLLVFCVSALLAYTWLHYGDLSRDQAMRLMHFMNQRTSPENQ